jgi:hypothetical protein
MAQFILNQSLLNIDALGPITYAIGDASLGSLTSSASNTVTNTVTATANLSALVATATISTAHLTGGINFIHPTVIQPKIPKKEKVINTNFGLAYTNLLSMKTTANSRIDFSIIDDDSEVLLLV